MDTPVVRRWPLLWPQHPDEFGGVPFKVGSPAALVGVPPCQTVEALVPTCGIAGCAFKRELIDEDERGAAIDIGMQFFDTRRDDARVHEHAQMLGYSNGKGSRLASDCR